MNYCQPRPRHHHRGLPSILRQSMLGSPLPYSLAPSVATSSALPAWLSRHVTQPTRLQHTIQAVQKPAKSRNTHSAEHEDRGFGHPRLSGAYRQPKLFRVTDRPLLIPSRQKRTFAAGVQLHLNHTAIDEEFGADCVDKAVDIPRQRCLVPTRAGAANPAKI